MSYIKWLKKQEETFAKDSVIEEVLVSPIQRERVDVALSWIESDELVLDIGGGDGAISELIYNKGNAVITLDFPRVIATAKSRKFLLLVAAEATYLPFKSECLDTIFCGEVIEHILDVERFLAEMHRVLKPQGKLILTTPNIARLRNRLAMLIGDVTPWHEWNKKFSHIRYWTPQTLIACLEQSGFEPIKLGGGRSLGGGWDWSVFTEEEQRVLKKILERFTPHPLFLLSFICILARKV